MEVGMKILFIGFAAGALFTWLMVFGYVFALVAAAALKKRSESEPESWPEIAIIVPTLNEEGLILDKLDNLLSVDYPGSRLEIVVVDGGSDDLTVARIQAEIDKGRKVRLVRLEGVRRKVDQVNHALEHLSRDILVFTDADARLDPGCVRRLVGLLSADPQLAIAGATVVPESTLIEERIHWKLVNFLWWLEGEVFSSAGFSGVCYALRKKGAVMIDPGALTEDIFLALAVRARGWRVRMCPSARATELRSPGTARALFQYRRRRGSGYLSELIRAKPQPGSPTQWRFVRSIRIGQFSLVPWLTMILLALGMTLVFSEYRMIPLLTFGTFGISALPLVFFLNRDTMRSVGGWKLGWASLRYGILILMSLLTLSRHPSRQVPRGGKR
jgi:cellulose synthase/poly-beta-1,6-N-acetylglucosamine synthase-like glycosyltransferase